MTTDDAPDPFDHALESAAFEAASWAPLPLRAAAAPADAVPALLAWAERAGAWFEPIEIVVAADGNRTVRARRAVAAGAPLVTVPRALMITEDDVELHPRVAPVAFVEGTMLSPPCTIGVWLALELADPASRWRPYLDALPPAFAWMALFRPAAELVHLTGTRALATIAYHARGCRADHAELGRRIGALAALPLADFTWGRLVSGSRCFRIDTPRGSRKTLVPVADMFDHGRLDATWGYVDAGARFEVRAAHDLTAGQEIQISYGRHGNAALVATYGFALADNPEDEVLIELATAGRERLALGSHYDRRLTHALAMAAAAGDAGEAGDPATGAAAACDAIAAAVRMAGDAIARAPAAAGDPAWQALCARVRAGEQAIALALADFLAELTAGGLDRPDAAWQQLVERIDPGATGAPRLWRELAEASGPVRG